MKTFYLYIVIMRVELKRQKAKGFKAPGLDDGHVVGGADGFACKVSTSAPADIRHTGLHLLPDKVIKIMLVDVVQKLERIATTHHDHIAGIDDRMASGSCNNIDRIRQGSKALPNFGSISLVIAICRCKGNKSNLEGGPT